MRATAPSIFNFGKSRIYFLKALGLAFSSENEMLPILSLNLRCYRPCLTISVLHTARHPFGNWRTAHVNEFPIASAKDIAVNMTYIIHQKGALRNAVPHLIHKWQFLTLCVFCVTVLCFHPFIRYQCSGAPQSLGCTLDSCSRLTTLRSCIGRRKVIRGIQ